MDILRCLDEALLLLRKFVPRAQHKERIAARRVELLAEQEAVHRAVRPRLEQQSRICRDVDGGPRHAHAAQLLCREIFAERNRVDAAVDDLRRMAAVGRRMDRPDAAAVHKDFVAAALGQPDAHQIIVQAPRARLVLNEAPAAGEEQLRPAHDGQKRKRVERMDRADMVAQPRLLRVV